MNNFDSAQWIVIYFCFYATFGQDLSSLVKNLKNGHVYAPAIPQAGLAVFSNRTRKRLEPIVTCETAVHEAESFFYSLCIVNASIKCFQQEY